MDKNAPLDHEVQCDVSEGIVSRAPLCLIDDVLNSGRTLIHGVNTCLWADLGDPYRRPR